VAALAGGASTLQLCRALLINLANRHPSIESMARWPVRPLAHLRSFAVKNLLRWRHTGSMVSRRITGGARGEVKKIEPQINANGSVPSLPSELTLSFALAC
jgi:hypothetical protein